MTPTLSPRRRLALAGLAAASSLGLVACDPTPPVPFPDPGPTAPPATPAPADPGNHPDPCRECHPSPTQP